MRAIIEPSPFHLLFMAAAPLALSGGAMAQSATDFRLQPGAARPAPGPVDPDSPDRPTPAPTAARPAPAPTPSIAPAPSPAPTPTLSLPPAAGPQRPATRTVRTQTPGPATPAPAPVATPSPSLAAPSLPPPTALPPALQPPTELPQPAPAPAAAPAPANTIPWWYLLPAALLGALGAWAVLARRKSAAPAQPEFIRPQPQPEPQPQPAPAPEAAPPPSADPLHIALEPLRFSVTLVNATLQYRLTLANHSAAALGPIHVAADMIAAHASLSEASQLGLDGTGLELRHEVPALAPGESVELKGDLRLPLAEVTPIRSGAASLLVPLVRLRIEGAGPSRTSALVIGEPPSQPGGPLRPFRLDHGPRIFAAVSQRALAA